MNLSRKDLKAASAVVVALLAVCAWWLQQGGSDDGHGDRAAETATSGTPNPSANSASRGGASKESTGRTRDEGNTDDADAASGIPNVSLSELPREAGQTVALIVAGGPFPYPDKDGSTFGNFEGLLPDRKRGYYAEYTVPTPGEDDRGARRIIAGDGGELYWTEDHYQSFERIRE